MNKFLISLATVVAFALSGFAAHADGHEGGVKVSGFIQQIIGAGDKVDGGITEKFTRFGFSADTTTDNGWTVGGSMNLEMGNLAAGTGLSGFGPTNNNMYIQTDNATISIGNTANAASLLIPRVGGMVPGSGHDGGYQFLFDGGNLASQGVGFAEAYYAMSASSVTIQAPAINGISVAGTYTPSMEFNSADGINRRATDLAPEHGETAHIAAAISGEFDGMSYTLGVATINGNSASLINDAANNDLASVTAAFRGTMGNISVGAHFFNNGDSFGNSGDTVKAEHSGYTVAGEYVMGNITVGIGYAKQELVRGTAAQAVATTLTTANAGNVRVDTVTYFGIGYSLGGGVNTYVQLNNLDHSDGDVATVEADPTVVFAGISLGF